MYDTSFINFKVILPAFTSATALATSIVTVPVLGLALNL
jgi:hypothetical protein